MTFELYKRERSPYYQARINLPNGDVLRKSTKTACEIEAAKIAQDFLTENTYRLKFNLAVKNQTVGKAVEAWLAQQPEIKAKKYKGIYKRNAEADWRDVDLQDFSSDWIDDWFRSNTFSQFTKARLVTIIKGISRVALRKKWITREQEPETPRVEKVLNPRDAFTEEEVERLLAHLKGNVDRGITTKSQDVSRALYYYIAIMVATGCRPGTEVLNLCWNDIWIWGENKPHLNIRIRAENTKVRTERVSVADYFLKDLLMFDYQNWQIRWGVYSPTGRVFVFRDGTPIRDLNWSMRKAFDEVGIQYSDRGKRRSAYSLRHYFITKKLLKGVSIHIIARQCGTSTHMLETYYSKVIANMAAESLLE